MAGIWNDGKPDDALDDGDLSPLNGLNSSTWEDDKKDEVMDRWMPGHLNLAELLEQIWNNIVEAAKWGFNAIAEGLTDLFKAVVSAASSFLSGLADAITGLFGGGHHDGAPERPLPDDADYGPLVKIADHQQALNNRIDLLEDNAGYCNLTMERRLDVSGYKNVAQPIPFNRRIGAPKNASLGFITNAWTNAPQPGVIVLHAPGVWMLDSQMTLDATKSGSDDPYMEYYECGIRVYRVYRSGYGSDVWTIDGSPDGDWKPDTRDFEYSLTRTAGHVLGQLQYHADLYAYMAWEKKSYIDTGSVHKALLIDDPTPDNPVEGLEYAWAAVATARFQNWDSWSAWGGVRWSAFTANRLSADTTDYGPIPDNPSLVIKSTEIGA